MASMLVSIRTGVFVKTRACIYFRTLAEQSQEKFLAKVDRRQPDWFQRRSQRKIAENSVYRDKYLWQYRSHVSSELLSRVFVVPENVMII